MKSIAFIAWGLLTASLQAQTQPLTLEQALAAARANRPSLQAARLRLEGARLSRSQLGASPALQLSLGSTSPADVGGSDDDAVLSQSIDIFGRSRAGTALGDAMVLRAQSELRLARADLQSEVISLYGETVAAAELAKSGRESQAIAERLQEAVKRLVEEGRSPGIQLTRITVEAERARISADQRESEYAANLHRLAAAIGKKPDEISPAGFPTVAIVGSEQGDLVSQLPELMLLGAEVEEAEAEARIARTGAMPELELQARRTPWQEPNPRYGLRVQLSLPLFDYGRSRNETKSAQKKAEAARRSLSDAALIAKAEREAVSLQLAAATEEVRRYESTASTAKTLVDRTEVGLREGANSLIDVLDSLRTYREVEESLVESKRRLSNAQARYLRASGTLLEVKE